MPELRPNFTSTASNSYIDEKGRGGFDQATFDTVMGMWLPGIICVLGLLGNALSLLVLSRDRTGAVTFISLRALASSDLLLLVGALCQQVIPLMCSTSQNTGLFCRNQGYVRVYSWPIICIAQMCSIWMTVLISSERYVAICYPLRASHVCSASRIRSIVICIYVVSAVFNLPKFFEFRPVAEVSPARGNLTFVVVGSTSLRQNVLYRYLYNTGFHFIVIFALPMITLTVLNVRIVNEIKLARKVWACLHRKRKLEFQATVLPLVIVLVYFVCGTQSLIAFVLDAVFVQYHLWLQVYTAVVNLLVILNSAVNFILMYTFGGKFRKMLTQMLTCESKASPTGNKANVNLLRLRT